MTPDPTCNPMCDPSRVLTLDLTPDPTHECTHDPTCDPTSTMGTHITLNLMGTYCQIQGKYFFFSHDCLKITPIYK